jgi:hypothetical protein
LPISRRTSRTFSPINAFESSNESTIENLSQDNGLDEFHPDRSKLTPPFGRNINFRSEFLNTARATEFTTNTTAEIKIIKISIFCPIFVLIV